MPEADTALAGGVSHQTESQFKTKAGEPVSFLFAVPPSGGIRSASYSG